MAQKCPSKERSNENLVVNQIKKITTEMKEQYRIPVKPPSLKGARSEALYKQAYAEVIQEMEEEEKQRDVNNPIDYSTEYDQTYGSQIEFKRLTDDKLYFDKLKAKYPLYSSPPLTIYRHMYLSSPSGISSYSIPGMTRPVNSDNLWNRYNGYTMPIDQVLQEPPGGF